MKNRICPEDEKLIGYLNGELCDEERVRIEHHISRCSRCLELLIETYEVLKANRKFRIWPEYCLWIRKNRWVLGAFTAFVCSFLMREYFLQFLTICVLMGAKWIFDSKTARLLVMVYDAWRKGDKQETDKLFRKLSRRDKERIF